ncbi:MAG: hypothetical protein NZ730_06475 [Porticoccaceae bacterium]|nr:hypothetical protein [Porticoccaceae bacterium]
MAELEELRAYRNEYEAKRQRLEERDKLVESMFEEGVIKREENGSISLTEDPKERQALSSKAKQ